MDIDIFCISGHTSDNIPLQYNYVINNGASPSFMPSDQTLPLVGNPQVLFPDGMNTFVVQPNGSVIPANGLMRAPIKYPALKSQLVQSTAVNGTMQNQSEVSFPVSTVSKQEVSEVSEMFNSQGSLYTIMKDENGRLKCPFCDYQCMNMTRMKGHCKVHIGQGYKCSFCGKYFNEQASLTRHLKVKHENNTWYQCEFCSKETQSKRGLVFHEKIHMRSYKFWCDTCSEGFHSVQNFEDHVGQHPDNSKLFVCHMCHKKFYNMQPYIMHRRYCSETDALDSYKCNMCGSIFCSSDALDSHVSSLHKELCTFKCACLQEFQSCREYDEHQKQCRRALESRKRDVEAEGDGLSDIEIVSVESLHVDNNGNQHNMDNKESMAEADDNSDDSIQITNMESGQQISFKLDKKLPLEGLGVEGQDYTLTSNGIFCCRKCSFTSSQFHYIKRHMSKHAVKKFMCQRCPQTFHDHLHLKNHENRRHYNHSRYKCDKCSRTFSSKGGITYHQQTKHGNAYKYKCETCDKGFNSRQHYLGHKNSHKGVTPFICDECGIGFSYPSVLSSHKKVCKGRVEGMDINQLDLYPCKICPKRFALHTSLQQHIKEEHCDLVSTKYMCSCGEQFELKALCDLHKTKCMRTNKLSAIIIQSVTPEQALGEDSNLPSLQQMSMFNQPVFPS